MLRYLLILLSLLAACSPKVKRAEMPQAGYPELIAFLPIESETELPRERLNKVRNDLASALSGAGFVLLDNSLVDKVCTDSKCTNRAQLSKTYGVSGFAELKLKSFAERNFLAGYVNSLSGTLRLLNKEGGELVEVDYTERDKGGLLFNSGQLIQGFKTQFDSTGDSAFDRLSSRFARAVVSELPVPKRTDNSAALATRIEAVDITPSYAKGSKLCVRAASGLSAAVIRGRERVSLRESKPGEYCGIFRFEDLYSISDRLRVEVRSPFGATAEQELVAKNQEDCPLGAESAVACQSTVSLVLKCLANDEDCRLNKLLVFRAESEVGPFIKVGESSSGEWTDKKRQAGKSYIYRVVALDSSGKQSLPIEVKGAT